MTGLTARWNVTNLLLPSEVLRACAEAHRQIFRADASDFFDRVILAVNKLQNVL